MDRMVGIKEVAARFDVSERGVWRRVAEGDLPHPVKFGKLSKWFESELDAVFEKKKRQRDSLAVS